MFGLLFETITAQAETGSFGQVGEIADVEVESREVSGTREQTPNMGGTGTAEDESGFASKKVPILAAAAGFAALFGGGYYYGMGSDDEEEAQEKNEQTDDSDSDEEGRPQNNS